MIARIWHGRTPDTRGDEYARYIEKTGISQYRATPGNTGSCVLRRVHGGVAEFLVVSLWESFEAIEAFAGEEPQKAVYYPEDEKFLLELEPEVRHFEVVVDARAPGAEAREERSE